MKTTTKLFMIWLAWLSTTPILLLTIVGSLSRGNMIIPIISIALLAATTTGVIVYHKKLFRRLKEKE